MRPTSSKEEGAAVHV